jgi:hypothetical protein
MYPPMPMIYPPSTIVTASRSCLVRNLPTAHSLPAPPVAMADSRPVRNILSPPLTMPPTPFSPWVAISLVPAMTPKPYRQLRPSSSAGGKRSGRPKICGMRHMRKPSSKHNSRGNVPLLYSLINADCMPGREGISWIVFGRLCTQVARIAGSASSMILFYYMIYWFLLFQR